MKHIVDSDISPVLAQELPIRLHVRSDLHIARKVWHMMTGLMIAFIYYYSGISVAAALTILGSLLGLALMVETARLRIPAVNERVLRLWAPFMRRHEYSRPSALPPYLLATIIAIAVFPKPVALLSILYLACGDPMASLFGILYGDRGPRFASGKSLIGTLAGVVTCTLLTFIFLKGLSFSLGNALLISLIGGTAGGTAELFPVDVDDNFSIPVISGFILWLAFLLFGA